MKFSFKNFFIIIVFFSVLALVYKQVLFTIEKNPNISLQDAIIENLNPFWHSPNIENLNPFPVHIAIPVKNSSENMLIPEGKITLWNEKNSQILNIGISGENTNPPGFLENFLPINEEKKSLPPESEFIFDIRWHGFGDSYFSHDINTGIGENIIKFSTLSELHQSREVYDIQFFEKIITQKHTENFVAKTELSTINPDNGNISPQNVEDILLPVTFFTLTKTLNTGLFVNLGIVILFCIFLLGNIRERNYAKISQYDFQQLEAEAEKLLAEHKKRNPRISQKDSEELEAGFKKIVSKYEKKNQEKKSSKNP